MFCFSSCRYPAGFVYFYSILYYASNAGSNIRLVQYFFIMFYLFNLFIVFKIYKHAEKVCLLYLFSISCYFLFMFLCILLAGSTLCIDLHVLHFLPCSFYLHVAPFQRSNSHALLICLCVRPSQWSYDT